MEDHGKGFAAQGQAKHPVRNWAGGDARTSGVDRRNAGTLQLAERRNVGAIDGAAREGGGAMADKITVLLVDDHALVRKGFPPDAGRRSGSSRSWAKRATETKR